MKKGHRLWQRLLGRLRYGLLIQELLNRLGRAGLIINPYFVVLASRPLPVTPDARCALRPLRAGDVDEVVRVSLGNLPAEKFLDWLTGMECLGIFFDGTLAGYIWARLDKVPVPNGLGRSVFELQPAEAYLFELYVASPSRGLQLAGILQQSIQSELIRRGRTHIYGLALAFNRSTRRYMARLGVRDVELRILLQLRIASLPGCDLRLWRRQPYVRSVWARRIPGAQGKPG